MTARVIPFPRVALPYQGTVCVMGDRIHGFQVAHESASGSSWGSFSDYTRGQDAIAAAYAINRDVYLGGCNVSICEAALQDRDPETPSADAQEGF